MDQLGNHRRQFAADLATARDILLERAGRQDPELVKRLAPPLGRPAGYGILPELEIDAPERSVTLQRRVYSLAEVARGFSGAFEAAAGLAEQVAGPPDEPLAPLVAEFERLRSRLTLLDKHLGYHRFWQRMAGRSPGVFVEANRTASLLERWREMADSPSTAEDSDTLRGQISQRLTPFSATPGLRVRTDPDGTEVLPVRIVTDIQAGEFLAVFAEGIKSAFSDSPVARERRFRVELTFDRISVDVLYPDGAPVGGAPIQVQEHLARFPAGALVLTTGASRTHAMVGRYVVLGPDPMSRRSLAHEFAHFLGFSDAYVRGFEGDPSDPYGVVFIEWSGLSDDLMGSPGFGRVSEQMIDRLKSEYKQGLTR